MIGAPQLSAEVADVDGVAGVVDAGGAGDQQDDDVAELEPEPARKGTGLA